MEPVMVYSQQHDSLSWEFSADFSHFRKKYPVFCVNLNVSPTTQACLEECSHVAGGGLTLPVAGASPGMGLPSLDRKSWF